MHDRLIEGHHLTKVYGTATGPTPLVSIPRGEHAVTLVVDDGALRSEPVTARLTAASCFELLGARAKAGKVQLTWPPQTGAERYDVYRSLENDPTHFVKVGETASPAANGLAGPKLTSAKKAHTTNITTSAHATSSSSTRLRKRNATAAVNPARIKTHSRIEPSSALHIAAML